MLNMSISREDREREGERELERECTTFYFLPLITPAEYGLFLAK
jgi:hypothetical protein